MGCKSGTGFPGSSKVWRTFSLLTSSRKPFKDWFLTWVPATGWVPSAFPWCACCCFLDSNFWVPGDLLGFFDSPIVDDAALCCCWLWLDCLQSELEEKHLEVSPLPGSFGSSSSGFWDLVLLAGLVWGLMLIDLVVLTGKTTWLETSFLGPEVWKHKEKYILETHLLFLY